MPGWQGRRRAQLPPNWATLRRQALDRDNWTCRRCGAPATDVDHIDGRHDHRLANLQSLCHPCHKAKTIADRPKRPTQRREPEAHPGYLTR